MANQTQLYCLLKSICNREVRYFDAGEIYQKLNNTFSSDVYKSRVYQTASLAVYDVAFSLQQFLSHRPKIGIIRAGNDLIEGLIPQFLRTQTPIQFKNESENIAQYLENIDKETNFVLWTAENEVTGEVLFSNQKCQEIHEALSKKRIFSVQIVNAGREISQIDLLKNNYAILIQVPGLFQNAISEVKYTDKFKAPSLIGHFQGLLSALPTAEKKYTTLTKLDSELAQYEYFAQFASVCDKISDRHVFAFKKISGLAVIQKMGLSQDQAFAPSALPSWILENWKNWWPEAQRANLLRGLLVISAETVLNGPQFQQKMLKAIQELKSMSEWTL